MTHPLATIQFRAFEPPEELHPDEWLERNMLTVPGSPLGGGFDPNYVPVIRDVLRAMADPENALVVLCCCVQSIKTFSFEASIVHQCATDTFPTMFVLPKDTEARDEMTHRLRPLLDETDATKALMPTGRNRDLATKSSILFNSGKSLWIRGAALTNLQRLSLRRVYGDECWLFDDGIIGEMEGRISGFDLGQLFLASQGSAVGHDFHKKWLETNQGVLAFRCPKCEASQLYDWNCVAFDTSRDDDENYLYEAIRKTARYRCLSCEAEFPDTPKTRAILMKSWHFVLQNPSAPKGRVGFRIPATAIKPLAQLVEEYLRGKSENYHEGSVEKSKIFHLKRLADFWDEAQAEDDDFVVSDQDGGYTFETALPWEDEARWIVGKVPKGKKKGPPIIVSPGYDGDKTSYPLRIAKVDVQRDLYYMMIRSYSLAGTSRMIHLSKPLTYEEIEEIRIRFEVHAACVFVDSSWDTANVYNACAEYGFRPIKGDGVRESFTHARDVGNRTDKVEKFYTVRPAIPLTGKKKVQICLVATNPLKDRVSRKIARGITTAPTDVPAWYHKQIAAEKRVVKPNGKRYWTLRSENKKDNHCLDLEVYGEAASMMLRVGDPDEQRREEKAELT